MSNPSALDVVVFGKHESDFGPTRVTRGISGALARAGHHVDMVCYGDREDEPADSVDVHRVGETPDSVRGWFELYAEAQEVVRSLSHDVFHALERFPYRADVRTVQWTSDMWVLWRVAPESRPSIRALAGDVVVNWGSRRGAKRSDVVVAQSPETARQMERYWRLTPDLTIPLGIEEGVRSPPEGRGDPPLVLLVGRIDRRKGQARVLDHLDPASTRYDVRLVGGVHDEAYAESALDGWEARHEGYLPREELYEWYRRADIVLIPSHLETFSMVALEAIATGCAVVISDGCGFAQFDFATPENGVFVGSSGSELARLVTDLAGDETLFERKRAAYVLSEDLTWGAIVDRYVTLYREVLSGEFRASRRVESRR